MGILNVTPDSFYDGGQFIHPEQAVSQALQMVKEGAAIIDVGGESTRPGAKAISVNQELERVIPVIESLQSVVDLPISIDTSKPQVMEAAIEAGAAMVNDVNGLRAQGALDVCARYDVSVCIMHMRGKPRTMQVNPAYPDGVMTELDMFFKRRMDAAVSAGIRKKNICIDPGFGFGKTMQHNYRMLQQLEDLSTYGVPILVGMSRKSMIGNLLNIPVEDSLAGSLAANVVAFMKGASIFRVHDVKQTVEALRIAYTTKNTAGLPE